MEEHARSLIPIALGPFGDDIGARVAKNNENRRHSTVTNLATGYSEVSYPSNLSYPSMTP